MSRTISIEQLRHTYSARSIGAKIRLQGRWLEDHGFKPGSYVEVIPAPGGALILRPVVTAPLNTTDILARLDRAAKL